MENKKEGFIRHNFGWFLFISVSINIGLMSWILYYKRKDQIELGDFISISSGLVSIALAVVAIIYSVSENVRNDGKEKELNKIISKVDEGVSDSQNILSKINLGTSNTKDILDKMSEQLMQLKDKTEIISDYYKQVEQMNEVNEKINLEKEIKNNTIEEIDNKKAIISEDSAKYKTNQLNIDNYNENKKLSYNKIYCRRGDIFMADLSQTFGYEQGGIRPVVIVQNNIGNRYSPTVVVVPITKSIKTGKLPTHVTISEDDSPLGAGSVVLGEQIKTIDKRRLKELVGVIDEYTMKKIDKSLAVELGLD